MIKAYFDVREPRVVVHRNPNCAHAKVGPDRQIRHLLLNPDSLSRELARFRDNKHRFAEEPGRNDMWIILDFLDTDFEVALAGHLKRILGLSHDPFKSCETQVHC
jgi:hypothetical protein